MAHIRRRGVMYRVEIFREAHRASSTHETRQSAKAWAQEIEEELGRRLFSSTSESGVAALSAGVRAKIPWTELGLNANECGELFGVTGDYFLRTYACRPGFPARLTKKPATWKAGEVVEYRNQNRVE